MIASIPWIQSGLNYFLNRIWFVKLVPKYLKPSTLSKVLLSVFILWLRPTFCSWHMLMCLVLSAFTSYLVFLLFITKASAFSFIVCTFPTFINIISITERLYVSFSIKLPLFTWTIEMANSKAMLKSNGNNHVVSNHPTREDVRPTLA